MCLSIFHIAALDKNLLHCFADSVNQFKKYTAFGWEPIEVMNYLILNDGFLEIK